MCVCVSESVRACECVLFGGLYHGITVVETGWVVRRVARNEVQWASESSSTYSVEVMWSEAFGQR